MIYLKNMSSSAQATQIPIRFVCVHVSSTLLFIVVCNRFSRCLSDHCFRLLPFLASMSRHQGPFAHYVGTHCEFDSIWYSYVTAEHITEDSESLPGIEIFFYVNYLRPLYFYIYPNFFACLHSPTLQIKELLTTLI